ncbi:hypothetical protein CR513_05200, partial [Mucuna pruriens]
MNNRQKSRIILLVIVHLHQETRIFIVKVVKMNICKRLGKFTMKRDNLEIFFGKQKFLFDKAKNEGLLVFPKYFVFIATRRTILHLY